jgi:hypothetical protein
MSSHQARAAGPKGGRQNFQAHSHLPRGGSGKCWVARLLSCSEALRATGAFARMGKSMDRQKNFTLALWLCASVSVSDEEKTFVSLRRGKGQG